jgi:replicative DNA helicase
LSVLFKTLKFYFDKYPDKDSSLDEFSAFFFNYYPRLKKEEIDAYQSILSQVRESTVSDEKAQDLLSKIEARAGALRLAETAIAFSEGKATSEELNEASRRVEVPDVARQDTQFVTDDLDEILNATYLKPGLRWRLRSLNRSLGSLRLGDFGFVFARPETGKTTFLASEVTHFASQAEGPIIWFNNEEQGKKVKERLYHAALGEPLAYLLSNRKKAQDLYLQITKGNIKLVDTGALFRHDVEKILAGVVQPSLIIFDQIDKVRGFNADRNDLVMGSIYQWARELAKSVAPVIGVCQADASGDGQKWLTMNNVAEAKTAKQGEADWILGIGKTYDEQMEFVRHFYISKNKLTGDPDSDPSWRHGKWDVLIQPELARYKDLGE